MNNIDVLNNRLILSMDDKHPIGLADGKMGLCIYFYYLSRENNKGDKYKQVAEKLLDDIIDNICQIKNIGIESGLTGIAIGISHLVKKRFISGDLNEILEDIDCAVFKRLAFINNSEVEDKISKTIHIQVLYYLSLRYKEQSSFDNMYIYQELIIKTIENFAKNLDPIFFHEHFSFAIRNYYLPLSLYVFSKIYELNIYNDRINKILEEFANQMFSSIPVLHANRLFLLWGLLHVKKFLPNYKKQIDSQISLLKGRIDIYQIISIELNNQDVYLTNGLSFVYMLLFYIQTEYPEYKIEFSPQLFIERIKTSEVWDALKNRDYYFYEHTGLFDGYPGTNLTLLHLKNHLS